MKTVRKTWQVFEMFFLLLALALLWGAESWTERKDAKSGGHLSGEDDLTTYGTGSFIGS